MFSLIGNRTAVQGSLISGFEGIRHSLPSCSDRLWRLWHAGKTAKTDLWSDVRLRMPSASYLQSSRICWPQVFVIIFKGILRVLIFLSLLSVRLSILIPGNFHCFMTGQRPKLIQILLCLRNSGWQIRTVESAHRPFSGISRILQFDKICLASRRAYLCRHLRLHSVSCKLVCRPEDPGRCTARSNM